MKALVIETAFLGDAIISLAIARELRRLQPEAYITYLVRPDAAQIIGASPDVDEVIVYDKRDSESGLEGIRSKAGELNVRNFDQLYLLHGSRRSQMLSSLLDIPVKIGFEGLRSAGLTLEVSDKGWTTRYERTLLLLRAQYPDAAITSLPRIECPVPDAVADFAIRFSQIVVIAPGSVWETKKWGDAPFANLASMLTNKGVGVIVIGGNDAVCAGELIRASCPSNNVLDLSGQASMLESGGAIAQAALLVANDSAPSHLAVAVGTPVLTIFGPTVPAFGFAPPIGAGEAIEVAGLWCRPCTPHGSRDCPVYTHDCMERIRPEQVLERIERILTIPV